MRHTALVNAANRAEIDGPVPPPSSDAVWTKPEPTKDEIAAVAALLASDNAGTAVVLQVTTSLVIASATYLSASFALAFGNDDLSTVVALVLPIPVLGLQSLQMVLGASAVWRAKSAAMMEARLAQAANIRPEAHRWIGSSLSSSVTDPTYVKRSKKARSVRVMAAVMPYYLFYAVGVAYTIGMVTWSLREATDAWWIAVLVVAAGYAYVWFALIRAAAMNFSNDWALVAAPFGEEGIAADG